MEELLGCGSDNNHRTISITDSTMMRIVHSAMNRAHERVKSREQGPVERLNELSKFYETAVMQLEACMELVDRDGPTEPAVLASLSEVRDRLRARLGESDRAMADKDRELAERAESESRLRLALEAKERELASLQANARGSAGERELRELKNSVDGIVDQMGSDIDALKETLDAAFSKIFLLEAGPTEQQWRWGVERDTLCVLITGLARDFRDRRLVPIGFKKFHHGLICEVEALKSDLSSLLEAPNEETVIKPVVEEVLIDDRDTYVAKIIKNHESIIRKKSAEAEELSWLRREVNLEKKKEEPVSMKMRVREVIAKLDNLIEWNRNLCESSSEEIVFNTMEQAWERINNNNNHNNRVSRVECQEQELEDSNFENSIMEEIYVILFRGFLKQLNYELCKFENLRDENKRLKDSKIDRTKSEDKERLMLKDWKIESVVREEICQTVFRETVKSILEAKLDECKRINIIKEEIFKFVKVTEDFERVIGEKLKLNNLRLEEIKLNLNSLVEIVSSLREKETLYRKSFIRRCQNLLKAEIEVDLLGDQVEVLLCLVQKIHTSLQHYSPVLNQSVWVSDLLQMINKEMNGVIHIQIEREMESIETKKSAYEEKF